MVEAWRGAGRELGRVPQITVKELAGRLAGDTVAVLDVRGQAEWDEGHIPGVGNVPVGYLTDRLDAVPRDTPVVVHCQSGARSAIAASLLRARGIDAINLSGGFAAWTHAGHAVERGTPADEPVDTRAPVQNR